MKLNIEQLFKHYYFNEDTTIVVATSGGPDSMALLHMLISLTKKPNIICAHVNHNKRKESSKDQELVAAFCKKHNIIFEQHTIEEYSDDNFHNQARKIRYDFFENLINLYKADYLLTAHHADDLVETMLMRLVRGTNLDGLAGIKEITNRKNYKIIRPLLSISKETLIDYNESNKITYRIDKSNQSDAYTRNRYRKNIIPLIKNENPRYQKSFIDLSNELIKQNQLITNIVNKKYHQVVDNNEIDINEINLIDEYIKQKVIEKWLHHNYLTDINKINKKHVRSIMQLLKSTISNSSVHLPNNKIVIRSYNILKFKNIPDLLPFKEELINNHELPNHKIISVNPTTYDNSNCCTKLVTNKLALPLYVTNIDLNAKIRIKNSLFYKKINRILIDEKISVELRTNLIMVVDSNGEVVWIPGIKKSIYDVDKETDCDIILRYH